MQYGKLADVRCKGRVLVEINNEIAAVVTCGASGLGEAVVRSLAARGRALRCSTSTPTGAQIWPVNAPRFRALALFERRTHERVVRSSSPAAENLHTSRPEQVQQTEQAYSITSSARASNVGGTVRPSAFAVVRLIIRSNLMGCSTGRSAGFAPRRILSTKSAERRGLGSWRHMTVDPRLQRALVGRRSPAIVRLVPKY